MNVVKKITWLEEMDCNHLDSVWYGRCIVHIETEKYDFYISAIGDVRIVIDGETFVDKSESGQIGQKLKSVGIDTDDKLRKAEKDGRIEWLNNNWYELEIFDKKKNKFIVPYDDMVVEDLSPYDNFEWLSATISDLEEN